MDAAARIAVRPATPEDAPDLARINRRSRAAAMPWLGEVRSEAEVEAWLRRYLIPREHVLCAGGDEPLGYIGFGEEEGGWSVHDLYIDPMMQGRGYGTALLRCAMDATGGSPLHLRCFARNQAARGFYERHGFTVEAQGDGTQNEEGEPDILYVRSPSEPMRGIQS
jgi:RimJ/RimL family protein N-acetyltransferase